MSFSEIGYKHQILRVDLEGDAVKDVASIPVPRAVELLRVPARPAPVDDVLATLSALNLPDAPEPAWPYLEVRVQLDAPEPTLRSRIEAVLDGKPVRLAKIEISSARATVENAAPISLDELELMQPDDVFKRLYRERYDSDVPNEQMAAFAELLMPQEGGAR